MSISSKIAQYRDAKKLSAPVAEILQGFYDSYVEAAKKSPISAEDMERIWTLYVDSIGGLADKMPKFDSYHERLTAPIDYYRWGVDFTGGLTDRDKSSLKGTEHLDQMTAQISKGENVILLGNHQTEMDPQILSVLLEESYPALAEEMVFVAGNRVTEDPIAIPFSLGRNLLCIYSKRHINVPPEQRADKQRHNQRTMKLMSSMLQMGGCCVYVAPSGGRDRMSPDGKLQPAAFDPASLEFFLLMAKQARTPTHFYPLALHTYDLLPPPATVEQDLGERRIVHYTDVHIGFGAEIDLENFPGSDTKDKRERRKARCEHIFSLATNLYNSL